MFEYGNNFTYDYTAGEAFTNAYFGAGSGNIWLDDVACTYNDTQLLQCSSSPIGKETCSHSEDAGVRCNCKYYIISHIYCDRKHFYFCSSYRN